MRKLWKELGNEWESLSPSQSMSSERWMSVHDCQIRQSLNDIMLVTENINLKTLNCKLKTTQIRILANIYHRSILNHLSTDIFKIIYSKNPIYKPWPDAGLMLLFDFRSQYFWLHILALLSVFCLPKQPLSRQKLECPCLGVAQKNPTLLLCCR